MKPSHLEPFIDILIQRFGYIISHTGDLPFEVQLIKQNDKIVFHWETFRINDLNHNIYYPDTLDQFLNMMACFGLLKLPYNYKNDFQKLQYVQKFGNDECKAVVNEMLNLKW